MVEKLPALLVTVVLLAASCVALAEPRGAVFIIVLPSHPAGNCSSALAWVNREIHQGCTAVMLTRDLRIDGITAPRGSIVVWCPDGVSPPPGAIALRGAIRVVGLKLTPARIAVYAGPGTYPLRILSVLKSLGFCAYPADRLNISKLLQSSDVVLLPSGSSEDIVGALGRENAKLIESFVREGGGYVGICAGSYAALKGFTPTTSWLELVNGEVVNWPAWNIGIGLVEVMLVNDTVPVVYGFGGVGETFKIVYWNGPVIRPTRFLANATDCHPLAVFVRPLWDSFSSSYLPSYVNRVMQGYAAIAVGQYGLGRVVLFSPHPEILDASSEAPGAVLLGNYTYRLIFNAVHYVARGARVGEYVFSPSGVRTLREARPVLPRHSSVVLHVHREGPNYVLYALAAALTATVALGIAYSVLYYRRGARGGKHEPS